MSESIAATPAAEGEPMPVDRLDDPRHEGVSAARQSTDAIAALAARWPEYADAIRRNSRLAAAVAAAQEATALDADQFVELVAARELETAQRPIDVLVSRCLALIREHGKSTESAAPQGPPAGDTPDDAVVAAPAHVVEGGLHATVDRSPARGRRSRAMLGPPTLIGHDAERAAEAMVGNRYVAVLGAVGGGGATTLAVVLGHVLATCRTELVVVTEVSPHAGALGFRSGGASEGSLRGLVDDAEAIHGCAELARYVDRMPTRLSIAKSLVGDEPLDPDDYRRAVALLARYHEVIITDIGMGTADAMISPALGLADLVVVVTSPTTHGLRSALAAVDVAQANRVDRDRTVVLVNGVQRSSPVRVDAFVAELGSACATTLWMPWDRHLHSGDAVVLQHLHRSTIGAATLAAATVMELIAAPLT